MYIFVNAKEDSCVIYNGKVKLCLMSVYCLWFISYWQLIYYAVKFCFVYVRVVKLVVWLCIPDTVAKHEQIKNNFLENMETQLVSGVQEP
jgi:hypothetical protein